MSLAAGGKLGPCEEEFPRCAGNEVARDGAVGRGDVYSPREAA